MRAYDRQAIIADLQRIEVHALRLAYELKKRSDAQAEVDAAEIIANLTRTLEHYVKEI